MGGGLMQLVAYGAQDIYLTGNPQITFFKVVYRRHTNFSMEAIEQTLNGTAGPNSTQTCTISRNGDLIHKVWIEDTSGTTSPTRSVDGVIYDYIQRVDCDIGGQLIDRQTGDWNAVWWNLTTPESKVNGLRNTFVGNSGACDSDSGAGQYYYPLNFWFCRNVGLSLPLIALQYHEVKLTIKYGTVSKVSSPKVWIDYIYLDTDERRRFAQVSHEYLIEQVQRDTFVGNKTSLDLKFNHPIKELIFVNDVQTASNETTCQFAPIRCTNNCIVSTKANPYNNADSTSMRLVLNGHDRFAKRTMKYFKTCQPLQHHTRCPSVGKRYEVSHYVDTLIEGGQPIHFCNKPTRLIDANITSIGGPGETTIKMTLHSAGIAEDGILVPDSMDTGAVISEANTDFPFALTWGNLEPLSTDAVCLPGQKHITLLADANATFKGFINLELEELPLLIGGDDIDLGNIYCYSFALKPEEHQPSGTCNFSRIDSAKMIFDDAPGDENTSLKVFAVNYNVLRIMSGMGGLAYSN
jgi:hypothetical protein